MTIRYTSHRKPITIGGKYVKIFWSPMTSFKAEAGQHSLACGGGRTVAPLIVGVLWTLLDRRIYIFFAFLMVGTY